MKKSAARQARTLALRVLKAGDYLASGGRKPPDSPQSGGLRLKFTRKFATPLGGYSSVNRIFPAISRQGTPLCKREYNRGDVTKVAVPARRSKKPSVRS